MAKILSLLAAALLFFGCEGTEGPMGPPGEGVNWDVAEYTVNQWTLSGSVNGDNSFYFADLTAPALTPFVAGSGNVFVYMYTGNNIQTPLPYVTHKTDGAALWTETYDFDFTPGSIRVYVQYSDFNTVVVPGKSRFRVVLNW